MNLVKLSKCYLITSQNDKSYNININYMNNDILFTFILYSKMQKDTRTRTSSQRNLKNEDFASSKDKYYNVIYIT
jgi:hypothetical protein